MVRVVFPGERNSYWLCWGNAMVKVSFPGECNCHIDFPGGKQWSKELSQGKKSSVAVAADFAGGRHPEFPWGEIPDEASEVEEGQESRKLFYCVFQFQDQLKVNILAAQAEGEKLSQRIVQSPERVKAEQDRAKNRIMALKSTEEEKQRRLGELQRQKEAVITQQQNADKAVRLLRDISNDSDRLT